MVDADTLQVVEQPPLGRPEPAGGELEQRHERLDPEAGLTLLHEERLPQPHGKLPQRCAGRGPRSLVGLRPGPVCQPRPQNRRADGIAARGGGPGQRSQALFADPRRGRLLERLVILDCFHRSFDLTVCAVFAGRRRRLRRARRPRAGEQGLPVEVPCQHRFDGNRGFDRREHDRPRGGVKASQLEKHRREFGVSRQVGGRGQQQTILPQDRAGFLELGRPDRVDSCRETGGLDLRRFECRVQLALDPARKSRRQTSVKTTPESFCASSSGSGCAIRSAVDGHGAAGARPSSVPSTIA